MEEKENTRAIGRNEPCPCGSGRKYKRCCGVDAAPQLGVPKSSLNPFGAMGVDSGAEGGNPDAGASPFGGFDPSQIDPALLMQVSQALQRLPKGQMQKLQSIMQKAMAGKDVAREAQEFEKSLPPDVLQMMQSFSLPGQSGGMPDMSQMFGGGATEADAAQSQLTQGTAEDNAPQMSEEETTASGSMILSGQSLTIVRIIAPSPM